VSAFSLSSGELYKTSTTQHLPFNFLVIKDKMEDPPVEVIVTTRLDEQFEDYLSWKAKKEAEEPEQVKTPEKTTETTQSKEIVPFKEADDLEESARPFIHAVTKLEIPYPPGAETSYLQPFGKRHLPKITPPVRIANRVTITSTAEIAANSPRYRRRSSTFIDGVHDLPDAMASPMAPAQLYSTMSGRLFHSGRIAIVLVGPPARGKT
jgi:hypothetical protein